MKIPKYLYGNPIEEWGSKWKDRLLPSARSKVLQKWNASGKKPKPESSNEYTKRRIKEETKRTWRSDAADIAHGIGEGVLALHPYTAIPYYGAKVGQDILNGNVNWSTALNASIPLFHLSPQAVGLKEATNVALEDAANAGSKTAKNWRVAREINQVTKNKPKYTRVPSKNLFRTLVYKGGEITDPYSNFVTTDPLYAANYGKVTPYIFESRSIAKAREPMMGYRDPVSYDMFIYNNTKRNPNATAIIGHDAVTGEFIPSKGIEILNMNPKNLYPVKTSEPSTSLKFFKRKPSKNNIVGASLDYSMKDSKKGMDFIKQFFALLKINGKEYTLEGLKDAKNVQQGLPEYIQSYLNLNTVERAIRAMRKNGYSEREILLYVDKVNEEMNKVKVGMYSDLEYNAAGALDFGGFYNSDTNFISINKDALLTKPAFTPNYIMKHEGRHLIDYNTSMTDDVINTLEKAYDKDFLEIPKHEDAGSLKDYLHMDRERVTTNRDAREVLLSNLEKHPGEFLNLIKFAQTSFGKNKDMVDFLNELILYAEPEDIINAVENSNGYGKRYINYLKKNNKLTSTKIEQLRLAMIHVPSYLLPIAGGYTLYNLFNQPQLQYLKQGGKMNTLLFLKNGSGIHIKEKNKGSFTRWCGGNVTEECIRRGKASSNPKIRKKATFADNARHFKHKDGGKAFVEGVNVLDSNPKAYKYVKKKYKMRMAQNGTKVDWNSLANVGVNLLLSVVKNKQISKEAKAAKAANKLTSRDFLNIYNLRLQEAKLLEELLNTTGTTINSSNIVAAANAWKNASKDYAALKNNVNLQNKIIDAQALALKSDVLGNAISNVMLQGMGMLNNYLNNKPSKTPNISFNKKADFGNIKTNFGLLGTYSVNSGYLPKQLSFDWSKVGIQ